MSLAAHRYLVCRLPDASRSVCSALVAAVLALCCMAVEAGPDQRDYLLFDGHIHYNQDVWKTIGIDDAIERLRAAGIRQALVSSTPTEGTERLFARDPSRIVPLLRPYRSPADRRTWFADPTLLPRLQRHLENVPYRGIGEFHVFGADASTSVMGEVIDLAVERGLFLHAHADADAIIRIVERAPELTVIWAHAGFDVPTGELAEMLARYPRLMIELSYRDDIAPLGTLAEAWRRLFTRWPDRFLVGMDTHVGGRWAELGELADAARVWLAQLPPDVADRIAFGNAAGLVGTTAR